MKLRTGNFCFKSTIIGGSQMSIDLANLDPILSYLCLLLYVLQKGLASEQQVRTSKGDPGTIVPFSPDNIRAFQKIKALREEISTACGPAAPIIFSKVVDRACATSEVLST
jgi:hypothetical protein